MNPRPAMFGIHMISFGLLVFIVIAAAAMPVISQHIAAKKLSFFKIWCYCTMLSILIIYFISFLQGLWESYKENPVFPTWGSASFIDYIPDIGALLIGLGLGCFVSFLVWLSMRYR